MNWSPTFRGTLSPLAYIAAAPVLILAQHGLVALTYQAEGSWLFAGTSFWLLPLGRVAALPSLQPWSIVAIFVVGMALIWWLAALSFKRATYARRGYILATLTIVPGLQLIAAAILAFMPVRRGGDALNDEDDRQGAAHVIQGVAVGVGIIVLAVLISAISFGAYGWGLFVATPLTVGVATGYLANRQSDVGLSQTSGLAIGATALGGLALITLALEGVICLLLAAPLVALPAILGGAVGRAIARIRRSGRSPIACVAMLPALFALEAAMPPSAVLSTQESITIDATTDEVWRQLVSDGPLAEEPGWVGTAGLAFPLRSELVGEGVGAQRHGVFSTGVAEERITEWMPGRRLGFIVERQPPAMEEMSPYRRVRAPHVDGYFETGETRFELQSIADSQTKVTVSAVHLLRIDPLPYWEPMARWAAAANAKRVLRDIKRKAEAGHG